MTDPSDMLPRAALTHVGSYGVPIDPATETDCDSCQ